MVQQMKESAPVPKWPLIFLRVDSNKTAFISITINPKR